MDTNLIFTCNNPVMSMKIFIVKHFKIFMLPQRFDILLIYESQIYLKTSIQ